MDRPPTDPADHARDFSLRYAEDLEIATGQVMIDLGLSSEQMGLRDPDRNREHHTFFPNERDCGGISPTGQVNLDSGIMNPFVLDRPYGEACGAIWKRARLRERMEATIAHEVAEHEQGGSHGPALKAGPETRLPISHRAREILRAMESGWTGS